MASTAFVDEVTHVPAAWANDTNSLVYNVFNASQNAVDARLALSLLSMSLQAKESVEILGGTINGVVIGDQSAQLGYFTQVDLSDVSYAGAALTRAASIGYVTDAVNTLNNTLGTLAVQDANSVTITGGALNGVNIGATTPGTGRFSVVALPNAPTAATDAVNKTYVDQLFAALPVYGSLALQDANTVAITGGTVNGVVIGGSAAAAATFTSITAPSVSGPYGFASFNDTLVATNGAGAVLKATNGSHPNVAVQLGDPTAFFGIYSSAGVLGAKFVDGSRLLFGAVTDNNSSSIQTAGTVLADSFLITGTVTQNNEATSKAYVDGLVNPISNLVTTLQNSLSGFGTLATQDANAVAITGGGINGTVIGGTAPTTASFTLVKADSISDPLGGSLIDLTPTSGYAMTLSSSNFNATKILLTTPGDGAVDFKSGANTVLSVLGSNRIVTTGATDDGSSALQVKGDLRITGIPKFNGTHLTGAGATAWGTNCPATNPTQPFTWIQFSVGGNVGWVPFFR